MVGKDKGKQGNVIAYIRELNAVYVGGLNTVIEYIHVSSEFYHKIFLI